MSDFNLVDPRGWEYDLQSVYSAYMGHFQLHNIPWYERTWGVFFESFDEFLTFSWPVITVTDCWTGKAHIVTRMTSIGAFLKMIKTRFGETLPVVENMQRVTPFETAQRHMRTVSEYTHYKKLYSTLPAAVLASLRIRVRDGEPRAIRDLWHQRDKTFLAFDFEWSERNPSSCLEWGYAAARCGHLDAAGVWPPDPDVNYRRGHYVVAEYIDKHHNKLRPNFPWAYAFGDSQLTPRAKLPQIIQAVISTMVSPDSETHPNTLVLVGHGIGSHLRRMEEMKIKIPHNVLIIDVAAFERHLFASGSRPPMLDHTGKPRTPSSLLSLPSLLQSLPTIDLTASTLCNAGNDAFLSLLSLQLLLSPENTVTPNMRTRTVQQTLLRNATRNPTMPLSPPPPIMYTHTPGLMPPPRSPVLFPQMSPSRSSPVAGVSPSRSPKPEGGGTRRSSGSYFPNILGGGGGGGGDSRPRKSSGLVPQFDSQQQQHNGRGSGSGSGSGSASRRNSVGLEEATERLGHLRV
ncbi:hypothetical protein BC835DRAFT_1417070 [Cytidiella melzeri]|nr:hypothetical protein BC835DRAFT_1417070 [Cytidiella melzeri]